MVSPGAAPFDPEPEGDGSEYDDAAPFAIDGDPATAWRTERYNSRDLGGLKDGVGLVLSLQESARVRSLALTSPDAGWSAEIYVAADPQPTLQDWGAPAATVGGATAGDTTLDLDVDAGHVLIWITDLGDGDGVIFELQEAVVRGR